MLPAHRIPRSGFGILRGRQGCDFRAHQSAVRLVEREHAAGAIIAALGKIAAAERVRMQGPSSCLQIARQERDLVGRIDPAQCGLVFQAIEWDQAAADARDVPTVQIAVALADLAARSPCGDPGRRRCELRLQGIVERHDLAGPTEHGGSISALEEIAQDLPLDLLRRAPGRGGGRCGEPRMHLRQSASECLELMRLDAARIEQLVQLLCLRKPVHPHGVVENPLSVGFRLGRASCVRSHHAGRAIYHGDLADIEIKLRRKTPVEAQLLVAQKSPALGRGEIDERIADRALDLVGVLAGKQHPGDVGGDELDTVNGMWIRLGLKEPPKTVGQGCTHELGRFIGATMR